MMLPEKWKELQVLLPENPGVYKFFDHSSQIIYGGKAKNLKKRVSSYFTKNNFDNYKTQVLVSKVHHVEFTVVNTEMDALLLENSLIKELQPKYNINLKDDKSYPLIKITNERFPKVYAMRNMVKDGSEYFGPFASPKVMHTVLDLVKKLYPTRNCNLALTTENIQAKKFKICLEFQIGNCKGPCEGKQTEEEYNQSIENIKHLLRGHLFPVKQHLIKSMQESAENLQFEQAQQYKEKLALLDKYQHKSTVINNHQGSIIVCSIAASHKYAFVNYLHIQNGLIVSSKTIEIKKKLDETDKEILELAMNELLSTHAEPQEFILPFEIEDLFTQAKITIPKAGIRKNLLDLSFKNALMYKKERLEQFEKLNPELRIERLMETMKKDLRLSEYPKHIECFDNSNIQGNYPVSACVVFKNGKPSKSEYRHFNVKTVVGPDDFTTMKEVIFRRYSRLLNEKLSLPQLIVIDGGKGQLSSAVSALKELHLYGKIAIISIAKKLEEIYYPEDSVPLYIDKKSETLKIIQQMRDEAHRFGITHHRNKRSKGTIKTELTEIPGIGNQIAENLLQHFKSVSKIKNATLSQLEVLIGKSKALLVYQHFHPFNHE